MPIKGRQPILTRYSVVDRTFENRGTGEQSRKNDLSYGMLSAVCRMRAMDRKDARGFFVAEADPAKC
jgi:hypothetical protein